MTHDNGLNCGRGRNSVAVLGKRFIGDYSHSHRTNVLLSMDLTHHSGTATAVAASGSCVAMYVTKRIEVSKSYYDSLCHVLHFRFDCYSNTRSVLQQQAAAVVTCGAYDAQQP
jgi:hypothetical protein